MKGHNYKGHTFIQYQRKYITSHCGINRSKALGVTMTQRVEIMYSYPSVANGWCRYGDDDDDDDNVYTLGATICSAPYI